MPSFLPREDQSIWMFGHSPMFLQLYLLQMELAAPSSKIPLEGKTWSESAEKDRDVGVDM